MTEKQLAAIRRHGERLLVIFPNATERDPVKLCKKLRKLEAQGNALALRLCNGPEFSSEGEADAIANSILGMVDAILRFRGAGAAGPKVFLNRDPRGYALKIETEAAADLNIAKDWGGYGLIAPEFNREGE